MRGTNNILLVFLSFAFFVAAEETAATDETPEATSFVNKKVWGEGEASGNVVFLSDEHFASYKEANKNALYFFYAPWCGHCKAAKPEYARASTQVSIPMVAMDCTDDGKATCDAMDVKGFPTIKYYEDGVMVDYSGGRKEKDFVKYLQKKDPNYVPGPFVNVVPEGWDESKVIHMTDEHFEEYRGKTQRFLMFFHANWCGHCKNTRPDYTVASNKFRRSMPFVAMDCATEGSETCSKFDVSSYPTFKYFDGADKEPESVNFGGATSSGDFITFVEKKLDALTEGEVDISKLRVKQLRKMLKDRGVKCRGCTEKKHFVDRVKETMHMAVKKVKKAGSGRSLMEEKRYAKLKVEAEKGWKDESYGNGNVLHSYEGHFDELLKSDVGKTGFLAAFVAPWCGHCKALKPELVAASTELKELGCERRLVAIDAEASRSLATTYKVTGFPTFHYFEDNEMKDELYEQAGSPRGKKSIVKFMMQRQDIEWKAEVLPFKNENRWEDHENEVVHMDDDHFDEYRAETENGFMAFFYAPWCGHCKNAKPHYSKASLKSPLPMLATDCTSEGKDTCSKFDVKGFPTIKFFPAGGADPEDYNGARDEDGFLQFLESKSVKDKSEL